MKILLKSPTTQLLLKSPGEWTGNPHDAIGFTDTAEAIQFSIQHRLWRLRVVLQFNDGKQFIRGVVPGKLEAQALGQMERLLTRMKHSVSGFIPAQSKPNPFAKSLSV